MVRGCLPRPPKKLIRSFGSGGSFFANNCGGCSVMEFGSMGWSGCLRCLLGLRPFVGNGCRTSVDGSFCSVVVPLEVVGGAGSLLPRAPVSGVKEVGGPLATGLPLIRL